MLYNKINIHSELSIILRSITKMITNEILKNIKHVHFIGIGGSGMYPLVQIFHSKGYFITGSDNNETETLEAVRKLGIEVFLGQRAENIKGADLIIYTAAIMADNPELIAAKASGAICCERAEILGLVQAGIRTLFAFQALMERPPHLPCSHRYLFRRVLTFPAL